MAERYPAPPAATPSQYGGRSAYPQRRRRRWPWVLLVLAIVLFGLFAAADRIAAHIAEDRAADALQSSENLADRPDVSIGGFPFLTQLAARHFDEVTVSDDQVQLPSGITLDAVAVHLRDVKISSDFSTAFTPTATADAVLTYPMLSRALGFRVTRGTDGRLVARRSVQVAGQTRTTRVSAAVTTSSDRLGFADVRVNGVHLPDALAAQLSEIFDRTISLNGLPFQVALTGADVGDSGVDLQLAGHDITFQR